MGANGKIRARLLRIPGVANVPIWGERTKMFQVLVDPQRLRAHNVSLNEVMDVTSSSVNAGILPFTEGSVIGAGGFIDTPNQRLVVQRSRVSLPGPDAPRQKPRTQS